MALLALSRIRILLKGCGNCRFLLDKDIILPSLSDPFCSVSQKYHLSNVTDPDFFTALVWTSFPLRI